jgi:transcriptional regulator with XRE-family HTH domain
MTLTDRLRELKVRDGLTEADLAVRVGIPFGTLHGYLMGRRRPNVENLIKLAKILGVAVEELARAKVK